MIKLNGSLKAWGTPEFERVFRDEVREIDNAALPLQQALAHSSQVSDTQISAIVLHVAESLSTIQVKAGVFYAGVDVGSCCADDPTPVSENTEYCELQFEINKTTAVTDVLLLEQNVSG